jgi:iron complex transport system substrate-binding protein
MAGWSSVLLIAVLALLGCAPPAPQSATGPAGRIISLSPHLTELAFAAGAGDRLVGVAEFSNAPEGAERIPRIGDAFRIDAEAILALRPDLVLGWPSGNSPAALERLQALGLRVVALEPILLDDLPKQIEVIGGLAGTEAEARSAAAALATRFAALRATRPSGPPVRVFYQIADEPLITVNAKHFIGQAITLCGGTNVFGEVPGSAPVVSEESVLAAAPDAIVANDWTAGSGSAARGTPLDRWQRWPQLPAVRNDRLYLMDPDLMSVPGPRLADGIEALCAVLQR